MQHIQRHGESVGVVAPGAVIAGTPYVVTASKTFTVRRLILTKLGVGDVYLRELDPAGVIVRVLPVHFPAAGTQDFPDLHFRVAALNTVDVFVNDGAGPISRTEVFWSGTEEP